MELIGGRVLVSPWLSSPASRVRELLMLARRDFRAVSVLLQEHGAAQRLGETA